MAKIALLGLSLLFCSVGLLFSQGSLLDWQEIELPLGRFCGVLVTPGDSVYLKERDNQHYLFSVSGGRRWENILADSVSGIVGQRREQLQIDDSTSVFGRAVISRLEESETVHQTSQVILKGYSIPPYALLVAEIREYDSVMHYEMRIPTASPIELIQTRHVLWIAHSTSDGYVELDRIDEDTCYPIALNITGSICYSQNLDQFNIMQGEGGRFFVFKLPCRAGMRLKESFDRSRRLFLIDLAGSLTTTLNLPEEASIGWPDVGVSSKAVYYSAGDRLWRAELP